MKKLTDYELFWVLKLLESDEANYNKNRWALLCLKITSAESNVSLHKTTKRKQQFNKVKNIPHQKGYIVLKWLTGFQKVFKSRLSFGDGTPGGRSNC